MLHLKKLLHPDLQEDSAQVKTPCSHDLALIFITSLVKYLKTAHVSKRVKYLLDFNTNLYNVQYFWKKDKETALI